MQAVRLIAKKGPEDLSEQEKSTLAQFHTFGCTSCHRVEQGAVRLTEQGMKFSQVHLSCPEVMQAISK